MRKLKISDFAEVITGGTPSTSVSEYWDGGMIPWLQSGACQNCIIADCSTFITQAGLDNSAAKMMKPGSVLIALTGATTGKVGYLTFNACANQSVTGIQPNDNFIPKYLYYFLRGIRQKILDDSYGGAQKHISQGYVKNLEIPLGTINEQKSIVSAFEHVDQLISLRQKELTSLDDLIKARFVEMFGDPVSNPFGLPVKKLADLGSLDRGRSQHRPRNAPELLGGPYPLIQTGEVAAANLYITEYHSTYSELGLKQSKMWKAGTLCITIAANIAQTAILTFDACFPDSVVGFIPNTDISALYMHYWFCFFQKILEEQAPQVAQKNINLKILSDLNVITPAHEQIDVFEAFVAQVDKSKSVIQKSLDETQLLFDSLMQKYFG